MISYYSIDDANALTVSPNYVYLGGDEFTDDTSTTSASFVARFLLSGVPDTSYGSGGFASAPAGGDTHTVGVAVNKTGQAVVAGTDCPLASDGTRETDLAHGFITRFTAGGAYDPTFAGTVNFGNGNPSNSQPTSMTMQSGGVVVAGIDTACNNPSKACIGLERTTRPEPMTRPSEAPGSSTSLPPRWTRLSSRVSGSSTPRS